MSKQKLEIEVDVPDGYELTGEYRRPVVGETILRRNTAYVATSRYAEFMWPILRKIEPEIRTGWVKVYPVGLRTDVVHSSRQHADLAAGDSRIACVEFQYEVPWKVA